jgi:DNA polymerase III subunit epsilon
MKNSDSVKLLSNLSFCVFDLETTGSNQKNDKIIEIGLVKIENLKITKTKDFLINPEMKIPEFIQNLTGISQESVKNSPLIEDVIDEIIEFMGDSILVAHNISFDIPFFYSVLKRLKKPNLINKTLCTNLMTKFLMPTLVNSNLNYMCSIFHIPHKKAHKAIDDALASASLLLIYLNIFIDKGITKINHLYYPRNRFELDRTHYLKGIDPNFIFEDLKKVKTPFTFKIKGEKGAILFTLPCAGTTNEIEFLKQKVKEISWDLITIKLYGSFLEALILFANLSNKTKKQANEEALEFLWSNHLPKLRRNADLREGKISLASIGDFVFGNHLIPGQFILYPLNFLSHKSQSILKYPAQRKKLLQYLTSKNSIFQKEATKGSIFPGPVRDFFENYLILAKQQNNYFFFKKSLPLTSPEDFFAELDKFIIQHPNEERFPKGHF